MVKRSKAQTSLHTIITASAYQAEPDDVVSETIDLLGKTKDHIRLSPADIIYAKSSGNYVAIYYLKNGNVESKLLRTSLNQLNETLCEYPFMVRCHRGFMVNITKLVNARGNLKKYYLELENTKAKIPVSKSYTRIIKEKIRYMDFK